jgi:hypothetical protein
MVERILVCGGRDYNDVDRVARELGACLQVLGDIEIICGYDPDDDRFQGADELAFKWAIANGVPVFPFPAPWKKFGRSAGPRRNGRMLAWGKPTLGMAFPGGRGTADMTDRLFRAEIPVTTVGRSPSIESEIERLGGGA